MVCSCISPYIHFAAKHYENSGTDQVQNHIMYLMGKLSFIGIL